MIQGRYLLGVEDEGKTAAFLEQFAGLRTDPAEIQRLGREAAAIRARRPAPEADAFPCPPHFADHLRKVEERPVFRGLFRDRNPSFVLVSLPDLIPLQLHLDFSYALHVIPAGIDEPAVLNVCLPPEGGPIEAHGGMGEDLSFTVCTRDMNLRVTETHMDTEEGISVTFTIGRTAVFLVVVRRGRRLFVKDGTHRAVGLLARGASQAPAVLVRDDAGGPLFQDGRDAEILLSPHPPALADFLNPALHLAHKWRRGLKVIRIASDEFVVPDEI